MFVFLPLHVASISYDTNTISEISKHIILSIINICFNFKWESNLVIEAIILIVLKKCSWIQISLIM